MNSKFSPNNSDSVYAARARRLHDSTSNTPYGNLPVGPCIYLVVWMSSENHNPRTKAQENVRVFNRVPNNPASLLSAMRSSFDNSHLIAPHGNQEFPIDSTSSQSLDDDASVVDLPFILPFPGGQQMFDDFAPHSSPDENVYGGVPSSTQPATDHALFRLPRANASVEGPVFPIPSTANQQHPAESDPLHLPDGNVSLHDPPIPLPYCGLHRSLDVNASSEGPIIPGDQQPGVDPTLPQLLEYPSFTLPSIGAFSTHGAPQSINNPASYHSGLDHFNYSIFTAPIGVDQRLTTDPVCPLNANAPVGGSAFSLSLTADQQPATQLIPSHFINANVPVDTLPFIATGYQRMFDVFAPDPSPDVSVCGGIPSSAQLVMVPALLHANDSVEGSVFPFPSTANQQHPAESDPLHLPDGNVSLHAPPIPLPYFGLYRSLDVNTSGEGPIIPPSLPGDQQPAIYPSPPQYPPFTHPPIGAFSAHGTPQLTNNPASCHSGLDHFKHSTFTAPIGVDQLPPTGTVRSLNANALVGGPVFPLPLTSNQQPTTELTPHVTSANALFHDLPLRFLENQQMLEDFSPQGPIDVNASRDGSTILRLSPGVCLPSTAPLHVGQQPSIGLIPERIIGTNASAQESTGIASDFTYGDHVQTTSSTVSHSQPLQSDSKADVKQHLMEKSALEVDVKQSMEMTTRATQPAGTTSRFPFVSSTKSSIQSFAFMKTSCEIPPSLSAGSISGHGDSSHTKTESEIPTPSCGSDSLPRQPPPPNYSTSTTRNTSTGSHTTPSRKQSHCHWENCQSLIDLDDDVITQHVRKHLPVKEAPEKIVVCKWWVSGGEKECGQTVQRRSIHKHVKSKHLGKQFRCPVPGCDKVFRAETTHLKSHVEKGHQNPPFSGTLELTPEWDVAH